MHKHYNNFKQFLIKNPFLKDSSFVFVANISNALLNYGLVFLVARLLVKEQFSQWVTIGAFIALFTSFFAGINLFIIKRISSLEHKESGLGLVYQRFVQFWFFRIALIVFLLSPAFAYLIQITLLPNQPYWLIFTALNQIFFTFTIGLSQQFLMGVLAIRNFAVNSMLGTFTRLFSTVVMILLGFGTFALPLGTIVSGVVIYFSAEYYIKKITTNENFHHILPENQPKFNLKQEFIGSQATAFSLFCLFGFFTLPNFFSDRFLNDLDRDIFATIYSFGQMVHFGPVAFLSALVPHSSRTKNKKIIWQATGVTVALTIVGILFLVLFGRLFLIVLDREQYNPFLPLTWIYGFFILGYNILHVATKILIARSSFRKMLSLPILLSIHAFLLFLTGVGVLKILPNFSMLENFIWANAIFGILAGIFIFWQVLKTKKAVVADKN